MNKLQKWLLKRAKKNEEDMNAKCSRLFLSVMLSGGHIRAIIQFNKARRELEIATKTIDTIEDKAICKELGVKI